MRLLLGSFILVLLLCYPALVPLAHSDMQAVSGIVSGKVQQVGFRALIFKQAIRFNLAGTAQNLPNGTVQFVLEGDADRIAQALAVVRQGTPKSGDVKIETVPAKVDADLKTFTLIGWTSTSRKIATPYNLIFTLRPANRFISQREANTIYHDILRNTLSLEDLRKLGSKEE